MAWLGTTAAAAVIGTLTACAGVAPARTALTSEQLASIEPGRNPTQVALGAGSAWVGNSGDGTLSQVDVATNRLVRTIAVGSTSVLRARGCAPGTVHSAPDGSYSVRNCDLPSAVVFAQGSLWVTRDDQQALLRLDPATGRTLATIALGVRPFLMAAGMGSMWVTDYEHSALVRVDLATNAVAHTFRDLTGGPSGVAAGAGAV
jgi:streptogramin lyase